MSKLSAVADPAYSSPSTRVVAEQTITISVLQTERSRVCRPLRFTTSTSTSSPAIARWNVLILGLVLLATEAANAFRQSAAVVLNPDPVGSHLGLFGLALGTSTTIGLEYNGALPSNTPYYCNEDQIDLPSGVSMQVLSQISPPELRTESSSYNTKNTNNKPVLLFLHGSFHGAWCWAEHWFAYFVNHGFTVVAPSWRGTGGTFAGEGVTKVQIGQHVDDFKALLGALPDVLQRHGYYNDSQATAIRPVVICHSFGGLAAMKYLEEHAAEKTLSGVVTICSVPPSGNGKMTMRYLRRSLKASWRITVGFAMKKCLQSTDLCRQLFFGGDKVLAPDGVTILDDHGLSDADVERYQSYFARDSGATIDLMDLAKILPSAQTSKNGVANFLQNKDVPPCLVMGASDDYIVDREGLEETARYFGLEVPLIVDSPHDVMLGKKWTHGAKALLDWLEKIET